MKKGKLEADEIVGEDGFSLDSKVPVVQSLYIGERAETRTLFRHEVDEYVLRDCLRFDPREKDGSYAEETIMLSASVDGGMATAVSSLTEKRSMWNTDKKSTPTDMSAW